MKKSVKVAATKKIVVEFTKIVLRGASVERAGPGVWRASARYGLASEQSDFERSGFFALDGVDAGLSLAEVEAALLAAIELKEGLL